MSSWYAVYRNEVFQYYAYGQFMKINARANKEFQSRDIVTIIPTRQLQGKTIDELLSEGYDIDVKIYMAKPREEG